MVPNLRFKLFIIVLAAETKAIVSEDSCSGIFDKLEASSSIGSALLQKQLEREPYVRLPLQQGRSTLGVTATRGLPPRQGKNTLQPWGVGASFAAKSRKTKVELLSRRARKKPAQLLSEAPKLSVKSTLGLELPPWLQNKMVLPNNWKCDFSGDSRVCEMNAMQAGLAPFALTAEGRDRHEYQNYHRVFMPVGALPCCPTPPFCSAPKCADDFITWSKTAALTGPPYVCTKRPPNENFAYMIGQEEWPAYMGYAGGNPFDVHKHWDVLGRILGCAPGAVCTKAETMDLVIDVGANFGGISEELALRHFAKSFIMIDAAPFLGPDFIKRFGNSTWRQMWYEATASKQLQAAVPEFEFLNLGVSNVPSSFDPCTKFYAFGYGVDGPCPTEIAPPDAIIPGRLSDDFKAKFAQAQSAFVKIDVEGYDHLAIQGMTNLLRETRGVYPDGSPKHLINFLMLEYAPIQMAEAKAELNLPGDYDLKNITTFLEAQGFEVFLIGPRYLPLTHGSWDDEFRDWFASLGYKSAAPHCPMGSMYPNFKYVADCVGPGKPSLLCECSFATDLFAMRATHPNAAEIKVNLGACTESHDFYVSDPQYDMSEIF